MPQEVIEVKRDRFDLVNPDIYILQGNFSKTSEVLAMLDDKEIPSQIEDWETVNAWDRFNVQSMPDGRRVTISITLPSDVHKYSKLTVFMVKQGKRTVWYSRKVKSLIEKQGKPDYFIEEVVHDFNGRSCKIRGWVVFKEPVNINVLDSYGKKLQCDIQRNVRADVSAVFTETKVDEKCGFFLEVKYGSLEKIFLEFESDGKYSQYQVELTQSAVRKQKIFEQAKKAGRYFSAHGGIALSKKVVGKIFNVKNRPIDYQKWIHKHLPSSSELEKQKKIDFSIKPKISIVVPLYKTPEKYLLQFVESIKEQTYSNWELCLSDGSGANSPLKHLLAQMQANEPRILVVTSDKPLNISDNTNAAINIATGDFIAFADHDDVLTPNALYECVSAINADDKIEALYSDEDKMSMDGNKYFQPHMKPDFNLDLLCTVNYICHLFVVKKQLMEKVGMLSAEYDGAQDYDFILRCLENTNHICHIPKILYHWRSHEDSTAENPESKLYAFEAGKRAVQSHYDRIGVKAKVTKGEYLGLYRTKFIRDVDPLISILIPNKDHIDDLKICLESISEKSTYQNYEVIVIENNSVEKETFEYYETLQQSDTRIHVIKYDGVFNYSMINNFGANFAHGEYLLLLNNDTEIINDDCLEEMLGYCMRSDVGAVGARLYYDDDTIQHAGVVIGFGGIAGHCFVQQPRGTSGYCHRIICAQDYSAVTAACMMVKRKAFDEVDGLTEELAVAFNDIDFCLKLRKAGYLIVYNPYAELYHYESKSRGLEDTPEKKARFNEEIAKFEKRWPDILKNGDPYYNPNLTLESQDFSLKRI